MLHPLPSIAFVLLHWGPERAEVVVVAPATDAPQSPEVVVGAIALPLFRQLGAWRSRRGPRAEGSKVVVVHTTLQRAVVRAVLVAARAKRSEVVVVVVTARTGSQASKVVIIHATTAF